MIQNNEKCHYEWIKCPECNLEQKALVQHAIPFYIRVHDCIKCKYLIMESEWNNINQQKNN